MSIYLSMDIFLIRLFPLFQLAVAPIELIPYLLTYSLPLHIPWLAQSTSTRTTAIVRTSLSLLQRSIRVIRAWVHSPSFCGPMAIGTYPYKYQKFRLITGYAVIRYFSLSFSSVLILIYIYKYVYISSPKWKLPWLNCKPSGRILRSKYRRYSWLAEITLTIPSRSIIAFPLEEEMI